MITRKGEALIDRAVLQRDDIRDACNVEGKNKSLSKIYRPKFKKSAASAN